MTMQLAAPGMNDTAGEQIGIAWNPAHADELLAGTGHTVDELVADAEARKQLPRFALPGTLKVKTAVKRGEVVSQNIAGIFEGSDPKLKDQYVVLSAHVDHLGVGKPINGDAIFNGAMDNAAGVATMLDIAARPEGFRREDEAFGPVRSGYRRGKGRSRVGLLCAASHRSAEGHGRRHQHRYVSAALSAQAVDGARARRINAGRRHSRVAQQMGVQVQPDPEPARNIFIRSDQYSFVKQGVPAIFPGFGNVKGSKEEAIENKWLHGALSRAFGRSESAGRQVSRGRIQPAD